MLKEEKEFHEHRTIFAFINDSLICSKPKDDRSHKNWLKEDYNINTDNFELIIRGYCNEDGIFLYTGEDFRYDESIKHIYFKNKSKLLNLAKIYNKKTINVYGGVMIGKIGTKWKPLVLIESVKL